MGSSCLKAEDMVVGRVVRVRETLAALGALLAEKGGLEELAALAEEAGRSLSEVVALLGVEEGCRGLPAAAGQQLAFPEGCNAIIRQKKCKLDDGDKRGAKRRRSNQYSCTKVTSKTLEDGYTWRKYGQKEIQNAKHPRSYYRCTHKPDRGCQAQRQAQLCETDPNAYVITYFGHHTCRDPPRSGTAADDSKSKPRIISFGAEVPPAASTLSSSSSAFPKPTKQEPDPDAVSGASRDGSLQYSGICRSPATSLQMPTTQASEGASEHGDVTSEVGSSMEFTMDGFFDYDDDFFTGLDGGLEDVLSSWPLL